MSWGIQNSFSLPNRKMLTPFCDVSLSSYDILKYWNRTGRQSHSSNEDIQSDSSVEHFRSPKMARVEAALFVSDSSISSRKLVQFSTLADTNEAVALIDQLNQSYEEMGSAFRIERVATGYRMLTVPKVVPWLDKLHHRQSDLKLSPSAMETLTIIAYRQPVTRADIEAVRGVQVSEVLKQLLEKGLIRVAGEEDSLGRPYLYDTTRKFLELFGLKTLQDLPMATKLRKPASKVLKSKNSSGEEQKESDQNSVAVDSGEGETVQAEDDSGAKDQQENAA